MDEIDKKIIEIIAKELGVDPSVITLDTNIVEEYDSDSLKLVEILFSIEDEYDIEVENRTAEHIKTVGDIIREIKILIEKHNS
jgi:acyl carrier protein